MGTAADNHSISARGTMRRGHGGSWRRGEEQTRAETEKGGDGEKSRVHERL